MAASLSTSSHELERVTIRFAGDSGDGMQLTGTLFTDESALLGNDLATFPDYPAEIRAPAGTVAGVSGFQVQIGSIEINTPGDMSDALVAMNPAALKANLIWVRKGALIVVDIDSWKERDLEIADMKSDPLTDGSLDSFQVVKAPITSLTRKTLEGSGLDAKGMDRCKNMFALGMMFWLYSRKPVYTEKYLKEKFGKKPGIAEANIAVLNAGYNFAQTIEAFASTYKVAAAKNTPGLYRQIAGNQATAYGMIVAAQKAGKRCVLGSYPITPASDILHELSKHKNFDVVTVQAEDEIAGICVAIGASFAGQLGYTTTSGPGLALKAEALGLAVMTELPLVLICVQRGGPSTGLPTKTEQADLNLALYGRHGESPLPIVAASTPSNCFQYTIEASRIALEHMTPVILLTDGYIANGSEPWVIPDVDKIPKIKTHDAKPKTDGSKFLAYERDEKFLVREWGIPGTPGLEHRIGGIEKQDRTGNVSYDPKNHELMCKVRAEKVARIANDIPEQEIYGDKSGDLLVIGWGGTYGALYTAVKELRNDGRSISLAHFSYINPLPRNTGDILKAFKNIVVCELNLGQFFNYLQTKFVLQNMTKYNKIQGLPFMINELKWHFETLLSGGKNVSVH